jgi:hypothetical protein
LTTEKTPRYDSQEEILEDHEGICPMCNIMGANLTVCQQCMESVFVRLPEHDKAEGSKDNQDEAEDNQVVITMEGGKSRQHGRTKTTQWLLDSGATVHVTNDSDVLLRARKSNEQVRVGNGEDAKAERIGDVEMIVGENDKFLLKDVLYVPGFLKNVVSLTKIVNNGITVQLDKDHVKFGMNGKILKINKHRKDDMWYIKLRTKTPSKIMATGQRKRDINEAHEKLGHPSERTTRLADDRVLWMDCNRRVQAMQCMLEGKGKSKGREPQAKRGGRNRTWRKTLPGHDRSVYSKRWRNEI